MLKNKLFIKIYLAFWTASLLIMVTQITIDRMHNSGPRLGFVKGTLGYSLSVLGTSVIDMYENGNETSFAHTVDIVSKEHGMTLFLFDDGGKELTGNTPPDAILNLATLAHSTRSEKIHLAESLNMLAQPVAGDNGEYVIAAIVPERSLRNAMGRPPFMLRPLIIAMLVSGAVCYWLARYFTTPLEKLHRAVLLFAGGELSIRVSPAIGGREDEISGLALAFDRMAGRIQAFIISQKKLLRDISHELRSPLARISVALELCRDSSTPNTSKCLDRIERETQRLDTLIGQILALNALETAMPEKEHTDIDIEALIHQIVRDADFEARGANKKVAVTTAENCTIKGNPEFLRRAIENVIRNAVSHTEEDSTVEVSFQPTTEHGQRFIAITIRDYGPGVPEDEIQHLFEPFYRVNNADNKNRSGAGIGLVITETAIRFHGGAVRASNAPGGGFIVEVLVPA